jgi:mannose-6-phosphate isomerase
MSSSALPALLRFEEACFKRIWGGTRLRESLGKDIPADQRIGEAWMISDHREHESVVADGPCAGKTLRRLIEEDAGAVLGSRARLTVQGRFPLLLKLLDSGEALSVQVHPDDKDAERLGEPDVGKTEMWHVFEADRGSELICGLESGVRKEDFASMITDGSFEDVMTRFPAPPGTTAFVPAGTVHAIGGGILLAEIQQNSDLTYRIYDWNRVDDEGNPRQLHLDKAMEVIHFDSPHAGPSSPLAFEINGCRAEMLGACRHFAAERIFLDTHLERLTKGESFHILLQKTGSARISSGQENAALRAGEALLVTGAAREYRAEGRGELLVYYTPDLKQDVIAPLSAAGHGRDAIIALGGAPGASELADCF